MKFPSPLSVGTVAEIISAEISGNTSIQVSGMNEIHKVERGDLVFVDHPKYYDKCLRSAASAIIIDREVEVPEGKALLVHPQPFEAWLKLVRHFRPFRPAEGLRHPTAQTGEGTIVFPQVFLGEGVRIGRNCIIHPMAVIGDYTEIGDGVIVGPGTVIGFDAFYYNARKDRERWYRKMESCGKVVIEDEVEIGAHCTIDRGVTHETRIGAGTKIDNLVHIGHDTVIGKNCLIAAQVGIAGAVEIGNGVTLWGQVGIAKTLSIGDNAVINAQSGVPSSLPGGKIYFGYPAVEASEKLRELVWIKRIPELWKKVMG